MYQSLYRTYRPNGFDEIVGQETIVKTLKNQILSKRIAHAYLFCGTRGTGKTSAARIVAQAVNCENPINASPCHECKSCKSIANESSLDVFEMDAASNSKVDEIRDLLEKVQYPPQFSRYKVYIIDEVHMLSNAAFNALLKTLEEPPSYMIFILATTEPQKLPATILSRCQRFDFGRINEEAIIKRLKIATNENASDSALQLIASAAEGSMRDAWSLLEVCINSDEYLNEDKVRSVLGAVSRDFLNEYTRALVQKDMEKIQACVNKIIDDGKDVQVFLRDYTRLIKALIAIKLGSKSSEYYSSDKQLLELSRLCTIDWLVLLLDNVVHAEADTKWAASPSSILLLFSMKACFLGDEKNLLAFSSRLSRLEKLFGDIQSGISSEFKGKIDLNDDISSINNEMFEVSKNSDILSENAVFSSAETNTNEEKQNIQKSIENSDQIELAAKNQNNQSENSNDSSISCISNTYDEARNDEQFFEESDTTEKADDLNTMIQSETTETEIKEESKGVGDSMTTKDYERLWNTMLMKWLPSSYPSKQSSFSVGHYSGFLENSYTLIYNNDEFFHYKLIYDTDFIAAIEKYLSDKAGKKLSVKIKLLGADEPKVGQNDSDELLKRMISLCGKENVEIK